MYEDVSHQAIEIYRLRLLLCWGVFEAFGDEASMLPFRFRVLVLVLVDMVDVVVDVLALRLFVATMGEEADDMVERPRLLLLLVVVVLFP